MLTVDWFWFKIYKCFKYILYMKTKQCTELQLKLSVFDYWHLIRLSYVLIVKRLSRGLIFKIFLRCQIRESPNNNDRTSEGRSPALIRAGGTPSEGRPAALPGPVTGLIRAGGRPSEGRPLALPGPATGPRQGRSPALRGQVVGPPRAVSPQILSFHLLMLD